NERLAQFFDIVKLLPLDLARAATRFCTLQYDIAGYITSSAANSAGSQHYDTVLCLGITNKHQ
ncbi:hypothetical protein, partial [Brucella sp. 10RB9212]|uniref:hypothetical protein n=1 Tax=Brucella sp. 10RB9212 TaxID=1844034 RepID=UPI0019D640FC